MKTYIWLSFLLILSPVGLAFGGYPSGYRQTYNYVAPIVIRQRTVEFDQKYFEGVEGYYAVGDQIQERKAGERELLQQKNDKLLDAVLKLLEERKATPSTREEVKVEAERPSNDLDGKVLAIFKQDCIKCHGANSSNLVLVENGKLADVSLADSVLVHFRTFGVDLAGEARMPKGGKALSDDKVETLRKWVVQKAKASK